MAGVKKILFILLFLVLFAPSVSLGTVYVTEGFETNTTFDGTPGAVVYENVSQCECVDGEAICPDDKVSCGETPQYVTVQSTVKNTGSNALKSNIGQAGGGGAGIVIETTDYTSFANKTALYLRWYAYFDTGYKWHARSKMIRWHMVNGFPDLYVSCNGAPIDDYGTGTSGATSCDVAVYFISGACVGLSPWSATEFYYIAQSAGANKGSEWLVSPGGWYYFEVFLDLTNKSISLWMKRPADSTATKVIDAKSLDGCTGMTGAGDQYFGYLDVDYWINDTTSGSGGVVYTDDIGIADTYIGITSSTSKRTLFRR